MSKNQMEIKDIAKVCHEANRAYCEGIGDFSQYAWESAPEWQRESAISGVKYAIENSDATPELLHQNWCMDKAAGDWVYGKVKDAEKKTHPCLVPYDQLPEAQRAKDSLFFGVVNALKSSLSEATATS